MLSFIIKCCLLLIFLLETAFAAYFFSWCLGIKKIKKAVSAALIISIASNFFKNVHPAIFAGHSNAQDIAVFAARTWGYGILIAAGTAFLFIALFFVLKKKGIKIPGSVKKFAPVSLFAIIFSYSLYSGMKQPDFVFVNIYSSQATDALDGYRIVHISDTHLDSSRKMKSFSRTMERINALNADLILMTGDILDRGIDESSSAGYFANLKAADGVYASVGNHEGYYDKKTMNIPLLEKMGLRVLHNQSIDMPKFSLTGIGDITFEHLSAEQAAAPVGNGRAKDSAGNPLPEIVMSHTPKHYEAIAAKNPMLVLSGHTGFSGFPAYTAEIQAFLRALYHREHRFLCDSRGKRAQLRNAFSCRFRNSGDHLAEKISK
ncbi:MAG: metallophosphoesterase [Elusimicrobiales bacterium]|nr:metallophosphoesterase [Elusimicrobiales bacterium]